MGNAIFSVNSKERICLSICLSKAQVVMQYFNLKDKIDFTADFSAVFSCNPQVQSEILQIFWKIDVLET